MSGDGGNTFLGRAIGVGITLGIMAALFRKIGQIGKLTTVLFVVMLVAVFSTIIAVYDYLGYNTTAYLGAEMRDPGRTIPRSIVFSILGIMGIYFLLQIGVLGSLPLDEIKSATSVASSVLERAWGSTAAQIITVLIVVAAIGSVFAKLHPKLNLPTAGVLTMGVITIIGSLFTLTTIINAAVATLVIIQSLAQVAAIVVLRQRQPNLQRPYRQWLYPLPTIIAVVGWIYVYVSATWLSIALSLGWIVIGCFAFLIYAKAETTWPFGPKEIRETFVEEAAAP